MASVPGCACGGASLRSGGRVRPRRLHHVDHRRGDATDPRRDLADPGVLPGAGGASFGTARAMFIAVPGGLCFALLLPLADKGPRLAFASVAMMCAGCVVVIGNVIVDSFTFLLTPMRHLRDLPRRPAWDSVPAMHLDPAPDHPSRPGNLARDLRKASLRDVVSPSPYRPPETTRDRSSLCREVTA